MNKKFRSLIFFAWCLIAVVLFFNLQAAVLFFLQPEVYMSGFGLEAAVGRPVVRGFGLLFLMWNIPYLFALADPIRHRVSLIEAVIMQGLALAGETAILGMDGSMPPAAQETIRRFILFDGGGLILLLVSFFICERVRKQYCGTTE